jgi:hypothetical protein
VIPCLEREVGDSQASCPKNLCFKRFLWSVFACSLRSSMFGTRHDMHCKRSEVRYGASGSRFCIHTLGALGSESHRRIACKKVQNYFLIRTWHKTTTESTIHPASSGHLSCNWCRFAAFCYNQLRCCRLFLFREMLSTIESHEISW